jgi:hypothetical protein
MESLRSDSHDPSWMERLQDRREMAFGDGLEAGGRAAGSAVRRGGFEDFADAAGDEFRELALAFLAQEVAIVGGHGLEVRRVFRTERFEIREGFLEVNRVSANGFTFCPPSCPQLYQRVRQRKGEARHRH